MFLPAPFPSHPAPPLLLTVLEDAGQQRPPYDEQWRARAERLVHAFLSGRKETTRRAYARDLKDFARFLQAPTADDAAALLLSRTPGEANELVLNYRTHMAEAQRLSPATVNPRLAALRSLARMGRLLGLINWTIEVQAVASQRYRDTRGPGRPAYEAMLRLLESTPDGAAARRDLAIVRLLHDLGLRAGETASLRLEDLDLEGRRLLVLGKGRGEREPLSLPLPTRAALEGWVGARGPAPGPLFTNFDPAHKAPGLTTTSIYRLVRALGDRVGARVRPHGLRHLAITEALDRTGGNLRAVQKFSRHRDLRVLLVYDDNRQDLAGEVASLVAGA